MTFLSADNPVACLARLFAVAAFAAIVGFAGVFSLPPLDRDEARFAQATAQMLETGDYVTIRFQEDERNKKPAGIYWLQAASVASLSTVEAREIWAYRIPSLIGAVLAALFTYAAGARLFGPQAGLLAALLLASAPGVAAEASIAKTDAMLLATVAAAQCAFINIFGGVADGRRRSPLWPFVFWGAIGAGVLIKGPIILMIVGLTGAAMAIHRPRLDWMLALRPVTGVVILLLMIAPWAIAIDRATEGRFFADAIGGDMLGKIGDAQERHGAPPGFYTLLVFALLWPASALIIPALRQAIATRRAWSSWFLLAWIAPSWIVFEAIATKLPHYTLPLYPALAILAARATLQGSSARWDLLRKAGSAAYIGVGLILAALIALLPLLYDQEGLKAYCLILAATIGLAAAAIGALYWRRRTLDAAIAASLLGASVAWTLMTGVLPNLDRLALSPRIARAVDDAGLSALHDGAPPTILAGYYEPSAIFLLGTRTALTDGADAAERLAGAPAAAVVEGRQESAFLERAAAHRMQVERIAEIEGLNYSNGDDVVLSVWRRADRP